MRHMISGLLKHLAQSRRGLQRMNSWFCRSNIAVLINTHPIASVNLPSVVCRCGYTHDCIPCLGADITAFKRYHFVSI